MHSNTDSLTRNDALLENKRHQLVLLLHAHKCLQREREATNNNDNHTTTSENLCTVPHCATMRTVLQHMTKCGDFKNCSFNYCVQSRQIILHWKNCTTPNCFLCGSSKNSSTKEWQQKLHQDDRSRLVTEIGLALSNIIKTDKQPLSSNCLAAITKHAGHIEAAAFNTAISLQDYSRRATDGTGKIREAYVKKKQQMLTTTLSSTDESVDEQGPSKGTVPQSDDKFYSNSTTILLEHADKDRIERDDINRLAIRRDNANAHANTDENHVDANIQISTIDKQMFTTTERSINSHSIITTTTIEMKNSEKTDIDAANKSLPKHPAVFSPEDIRDRMTPILRHMYDQEEGIWFRQPVTEAIAPGYFDIIKYPMDFSTIFKKFDENQYTTPFQFWEDMWLVFNNTWTFNKKTQRVYKAGVKLADIFMELVDPIMKEYGYCCGRQYVFLPPAMFCYGVGGICCTIPRDGDYFVYDNPDSSRNNLSGDKYTFCKKCFDSVKSEYISVGDDPAQLPVELPKAEFRQAKNDHQEHEIMVDCIVCSRRFHNICVLYNDHIWPGGYVCKLCVQQYNIKRKENRYLAHKLTMTDLANTLEKRVNTFLRKECEADTGRVTIRVLAASDRICEVKPRFKKHFGSQIPDGYPYRTKAIFAFQEIEGVDVVLFGMHVQEYDSRCPAPNSKRVYISYLDSVHYFRPKQKRTALYYEILIGYLEYVKQLGFVYAHIWACPPSEGDDYIFYCHPVEQRVPKPKRLQEWYKTMLDIAVQQRVVVDYKDIMKDCSDNGINKATDLPYFEDDFWTSTMENLIKELEAAKASDNKYLDDSNEPAEPTEGSNKRKLRGDTTHEKKNLKTTTSQRRIARKNMTNGSDLISKIYAMMEKHKESFFVVRLQNSTSNPATLTDTDPLIQCDLMESRDAFLSFARDKHCEFSSVRRAKYSTMVSLIELHSSTADKISYSCDSCRQQCDVRYHCTVCEDYDLCTKCYTTIKHEHRMERSDESNETTTNSDTQINIQQQRQLTMQPILDAMLHAVKCHNVNCEFENCVPCKRFIQHIKECTEASKFQCSFCNKLLPPIWFHAKTCSDQNCPLPYCADFKHKIQRKRVATMQADRRRVKAMHRAKMGPSPSPLNSQNSEAATSTQYHHSMDSASPSSSGKMMPSSGKGSKGGKPTSQQSIESQQQQIRYASHGGKPMTYGQPRMRYGSDSYMMRQQPQQLPNRYLHNSYYSQPGSMPYLQPSKVPLAPHRLLSQNTTPNYSVASTSISSNGSEDSFDDPLKLQVSQSQQLQQQQIFHPLLQSRSSPQSTAYYPNMQGWPEWGGVGGVTPPQ